MRVLVFNVGSTTLKYAGVDTDTRQRICGGLIDRIGQVGGDAASHDVAAQMALDRVAGQACVAIAHRIVHGGELFSGPTPVTSETIKRLASIDSLAPLHNPPARRVVQAVADVMPNLPQTMVFDTSYYATLNEDAYRYAIPVTLADRHGIRRYGAHGTSHQFVVGQVIERLTGDAAAENARPIKIISLHLGGGASVTASIDGVAVDTSMGMTPLEGLVMATRSGDVDPAIPLRLIRDVGMTVTEVDRLLNSASGLLGLCGDGDMRTVLQRSAAGDRAAGLAVDIYVRKIVKTIGGYYAILGGLDGLIFTAGVGENSWEIRSRIASRVGHLGIHIDPQKNRSVGKMIVDIGSPDARCRTFVVPTNEELAIALQVV